MLPRVGLGFDVHPFSADPSRQLVLGGVTLDGPGLEGHSDADVVAHAVADALLGAAGLDDLGTLFPAHDPAWAGADSMVLLAQAVALVTKEHDIGNVDATIVLEAPRLAPHRAAMETGLTGCVGAPVTVKPKRAESLGALGRREGVACLAVAIVARR
ncbi:MAG TPA: 2-C-methyl-D-erythritol 2,4-cyclodiphosphate synthase [Acidimicrobiales bacterium]|nr:2-C-methyl-D-erythritol 2,4-cyclodiphosphate synthase [Acidimicrobiales bacterium]